MKKREIVFLLSLLALFLLTACKTTEQEPAEPQPLAELNQSKIVITLEHPEEIAHNEEFSVKISITNEFAFPAALSTILFPFSDFKFNGRFTTSPNIDILPQETKIMEYNVKRNMEADLGSGLISSLMQFDLRINDPAGSRDVSKREDFVIEFI